MKSKPWELSVVSFSQHYILFSGAQGHSPLAQAGRLPVGREPRAASRLKVESLELRATNWLLP